jgi:hypothetical protein
MEPTKSVPKQSTKFSTWLRGHYQYYGISGNSRAIERYHYVTKLLVFKWLNQWSQKALFNWEGFKTYLEHSLPFGAYLIGEPLCQKNAGNDSAGGLLLI